MSGSGPGQDKGGAKDPLIGQVLAGRYQVVRKLGGGGMGAVYEGKHTVIGKRVAIKVLHAQYATKSPMVKRFINEARAAATLGHPNIIDASDVGTADGGEPFLVLDFLEGRDLDALINEVGALAVGRTARIARQVASALMAAHAAGIIHRDMKPENVFLVKRGADTDFVKVLDFGISKFTQGEDGPATRAGPTLGTPTYMSPEQMMDSSKADARADVYSVGVMLYRMLTGALPFTADSFPELAMKVLSQSPPPLTSLRKDLPVEVAFLVDKAMARGLEDRYQTMAELDAALAPWEGYDTPAPASREPQTAVQGSGLATAMASPAATTLKPAQGTMVVPPGGSGTAVGGSASAVVIRRCPKCNESVGRDAQCAHCGAELPDVRINEVIAQRYRIDRLLGAGGMGRVYVGTHLTFNEPVAVKFLLAEWTTRGEFRARFRREAMTLAKLRHPGIVSVHDYGEHEGELYMVMELVRGRSLREVMPVGTAVSVPRALALTDLLLQVVEYAHAQGVVHRDLKPDNVMMLELGEKVDRLKVLDFGLALAVDTAPGDRLTQQHAAQGTAQYMSPEQCKGRDVGPPTDVYAVGIMLYEMLCGSVPHDGATFPETIVQQMFRDPPPLKGTGTHPDVPAPVEALVRSALAKAAEARPTAGQMREQIARILRGEDEFSLAEKSAKVRAVEALSTREERAQSAALAPAPMGGYRAPAQATGRVALWGVPDARANELITTFTLGGTPAAVWWGNDPPLAIIDNVPVKAVLLGDSPTIAQQIQTVRARPEMAKVAVVVVNASDVDATPALIRAGASDVAYANTPADQVCRQVIKLMRRAK